MTGRTLSSRRSALGLPIGLACLAGWLGLSLGWSSPLLAASTLGLPAAARVLLRRVPARGVLVGGLVVLLGLAILDAAPGGAAPAWGDLAVLGAMVPVALLGASWARSMRGPVAGEAPIDLLDGRWQTIVVVGQGPAPGAGRLSKLPTLPRNDPERRRLSRRVERRRELVSTGPGR